MEKHWLKSYPPGVRAEIDINEYASLKELIERGLAVHSVRDAYVQMGRRAEATRLFERLLALRNDVGLLAEEYDPRARRLLGNFPQAFSHLALVNTACNLTRAPAGPAHHRCVAR